MTNPTNQASGVAEPDDERAAFEAHFKYVDLTTTKDAWGKSVYRSPHVQSLWDGWQVRAALASKPAAPAEVVAPLQLPESMQRDETLKYYSDYANLQSNEALRYQKRIRDLEAEIAALRTPAQAPSTGATGGCGNAECEWHGPLSECSYVGSIGPCCPRCREIVEPDSPAAPSVGEPVTRENIVIGGRYNWKGRPERLVYMGLDKGWHQFAKVDAPAVVWHEVPDGVLSSFERSEPATILAAAPPVVQPASPAVEVASLRTAAEAIEKACPTEVYPDDGAVSVTLSGFEVMALRAALCIPSTVAPESMEVHDLKRLIASAINFPFTKRSQTWVTEVFARIDSLASPPAPAAVTEGASDKRAEFEAVYFAIPGGGGLKEFCWRLWQAQATPHPAVAVPGSLTDEHLSELEHVQETLRRISGENTVFGDGTIERVGDIRRARGIASIAHRRLSAVIAAIATTSTAAQPGDAS